MTWALDTSVVVRLLIGEPPDLAALARTRLEQAFDAGESVVVTDVVVAEAFHTVRHHYGIPRNEVREALRAFVSSGLVVPTPLGMMETLAATDAPGVIDRLIQRRHLDLGTVTLTFDRHFAKLSGVELL